jgi:heme O synthase-like polyprenyltransferase
MEILGALAVVIALAYANKWNERRIDARVQRKLDRVLGRDKDQR